MSDALLPAGLRPGTKDPSPPARGHRIAVRLVEDGYPRARSREKNVFMISA
jgi:hypothetical protein